MAADDYEIVAREAGYDGFFRLDRISVRFRRYDGGWSEITREVLERGHAAGMLLYDPARDKVVLVEQFRAPAVDAPGGPWLIETVAGIIEHGETPEDVARRETAEETSLAVDAIERIGAFMPSPGGASEFITLYLGRVDSRAAGGVHGIDDEDIRTVVMDTDDALAAVVDGRIVAANAVIALQWLALNRARLQAWRIEP
jgi:ADP-ribose pyrophosphatase